MINGLGIKRAHLCYFFNENLLIPVIAYGLKLVHQVREKCCAHKHSRLQIWKIGIILILIQIQILQNLS